MIAQIGSVIVIPAVKIKILVRVIGSVANG